MPKLAKPVPPVEIYARPLRNIQWMCPNCHQLHGSAAVSWRRGLLKCGHCFRAYRIGLGFSRTIFTLPPYNARFFSDWNRYTVNRLVKDNGGSLAIGRLIGRVDWICPDCQAPQAGNLGWDLCDLTCQQCSATFYISLLIHRSHKNAPVAAPIDFTPLVEKLQNAKTTKAGLSEPLPLEEASQV